MVSVARQWLIWGYHGLSIVTKFFGGFICIKLWLIFVNASATL